MNEEKRQEMRKRLSRIEPGWLDEGDGEMVSALALGLADDLLAALEPKLASGFQAFPMDEGGVQLQYLDNDCYLAAEIQANGLIDAMAFWDSEINKSSASVNGISVQAALDFIITHHPLNAEHPA